MADDFDWIPLKQERPPFDTLVYVRSVDANGAVKVEKLRRFMVQQWLGIGEVWHREDGGISASNGISHWAHIKERSATQPNPDRRTRCNNCHWRGTISQLLRGVNPFDGIETITGCPQCKSIDSTFPVCDEPGCWEETCCGFPTMDGYRRTCRKHKPKDLLHRNPTFSDEPVTPKADIIDWTETLPKDHQ